MRAGDIVGRYRLDDLVTRDDGQATTATVSVAPVLLWRGYDTVLDRDVALRVLDSHDARVPAVVGAAQASALVDDRRLLRVLDILDLPASDDWPATVAVVSEWATGRNLERSLDDRGGAPYGPPEAVALVTEIARALAVAQRNFVAHGRLRPSSVFITDAGEVRLRGLAVDAAVFGIPAASDTTQPTDPFASDLDSLGALLYLLCTGTWPGSGTIDAPASPRSGDQVLAPSRVRASVPSSVDDLIARSLLAASRPKKVARFTDATGFASSSGATLDYLAPVSTTAHPPHGWRKTARVGAVAARRTLAVVAAVAVVVVLMWGGWQLITRNDITPDATTNPVLDEMLTSEAVRIDLDPVEVLEESFTIARMRSFDPFGDDDGNGKPDKRKGREGEDTVVTVNDIDPETAWRTDSYLDTQMDGKPGVGLIVDLGTPQDISEISLKLENRGGDLEIRAADRVLPDPMLWALIADIPDAPTKVTVRTPRPISARYVLVWLTTVPPAPDTGYGVYQQGISSIAISG